jgi:hypothetical protein
MKKEKLTGRKKSGNPDIVYTIYPKHQELSFNQLATP